MIEAEAPYNSREANPSGRRFFIALGSADPGPDSRLRRLPGVSNDLERMRGLFVGNLGYEDVLLQGPASSANLELSSSEIQEGLHAWRMRIVPKREDSIVLYYSGHGHTHGSVHYLCTRKFHAEDPSSGLETRRLAQLLPHTVSRLWVVLDICRAGDGAGALCEAVLRDRSLYRGSVWVLAACGQAPAIDQAFSPAFVAAALPYVRAGGCPSQDALARRLQKSLGGARAAQQVQQSSYGPESFNFLARSGAADVSSPGLAREPRKPSRVLGYLGSLYRASPMKVLNAPAQKGAIEAPTSWLVAGGRRGSLALIAGLSALVLGLTGLAISKWRSSAASSVKGATSEHEADKAERVRLVAGLARPGSKLHEARAAYAECVARGACPMPFASSSFAAEVHPGASVRVAAFSIARREVTQREFTAFLNAGAETWLVEPNAASEVTVSDRERRVFASVGSQQPTEQTGIYFDGRAFQVEPTRSEQPVAQVSWYGADAYCHSLHGRLPSEAEWAYAARGAEGRAYPWGEAALESCEAAAFARREGEECQAFPSRPLPVAQAPSDVTPEGVHDLGGNLSEWTSTLFAADSAQRSFTGCRPEQIAARTCHVVRGGSYWDSRLFMRGAARTALEASAYWQAVGVRCAWDDAHQ